MPVTSLGEDSLDNPKYSRWSGLNVLLNKFCKPILKDIFGRCKHTTPDVTETLDDFLSEFEPKLQYLNEEEKKKVYPIEGNAREENFDISIYAKLILTILDSYLESNLCSEHDIRRIEKDKCITKWIQCWRNGLYHLGDQDIGESDFEDKWKRLVSILQHFGVDMASVNALKNQISSKRKYQKRAKLPLFEGRVGI